jgi:enoyl-CoA hydratase/carnithine racemase
MDPELIVSVEDHVARVTLRRPESRNALSRSLCAALHAALTALAHDTEWRCLVIEGSGGAFASGADVAELERLRGSPPAILAHYRELRATQELLYGMERITIAAIDGFCVGAGLSLALACDLSVATPRSVFVAPPARLGLIYSDTEVGRMASRIGTTNTRDLLLTGRRVPAEEALRLGLIQRLSQPDGLEAVLGELFQQFSLCAPSSLRKTKAQVRRLEREGTAGLRGDGEAEEAFFDTDAAEGMRAFLERRPPRFS